MSRPLQHKLLGFEAAPPEGVWDRIAAKLDDAEEGFAKRLAAYAPEPPAAAWPAIERLLEDPAQTKAPVVALPSARKNNYRYAAAAALLGAVAVAALLLWSRSGPETLAGNAPPPAMQTPGVAADSFVPEPIPNLSESTAVPVASSRNETGREPYTPARRWLSFIRPQRMGRTVSLAGLIPQRASVNGLEGISMSDDFMVYSDAEGNAMRLHKKLFSLVNCEEGDGTCRERLQRLRQKLSASNASADFFGMIDQLRELE